jgi:predicted nucleic acid-binding protein
LRIYVETSVYGEYANALDEATAGELFARCRTGRYQLITSELVEFEIRKGAPAGVITRFEELLPFAAYLLITNAALALQNAYLSAGVVGAQRADDALHVALATIAGCDLLVTWDEKHIARSNKITLFNKVNVQQGHKPINILFPEQVLFLR